MQEKFNQLKEFAKINNVPIVRNKTGEYLVNAVKNASIKNILEIGTAIGYSAGLMLESNKDAYLTTIEKRADMVMLANQNLLDQGVQNRAEILQGDAKDVLVKLIDEKRKFDFVFLDGPKGQYYAYFGLIKQLLNKNAVIFADNIYFGGMVKTGIYPHRKKTIIVSLTNFLNEIHKADFESIEYDIEDGFSISKFLG